MSSAIATPDPVLIQKISERPVRVDFGHLITERGHLLDLSRAAMLMSEGRHPSPQPFAVLKGELNRLSTPANPNPAQQFASVDVDAGRHSSFRDRFNCTVTTHQVTWNPPSPTATAPAGVIDRLSLAAASAIEHARANPFQAIGEFFKMEPAAGPSSLLPRDLFQSLVADNDKMPVHYRERTLAVAYANAAINVHDYEPSQLPQRVLKLVAIHSGRAAKSLEQFCGMGTGFKLEGKPASAKPSDFSKASWKSQNLPCRLQEALGWTNTANDLGEKFAKRYALIVAEDILAGGKRWHT